MESAAPVGRVVVGPPGGPGPGVARTRTLRLARLRALRPDAPRPAPEEPPRSGRSGDAWATRDRARRLARDVGGTVVEADPRPLVMVERRERIATGLDGLAKLPDPVDPARPLVCLDTEATSLGTGTGTVPFLVGVGTWEADEFVVRQLLLPDLSDEAPFLDVLASLIPPDACLVTYNGRSFDWPLIVARYRLQGRCAPEHGAHLDLLPLARQLWRYRLTDARLASVEASICGVRRDIDLPGWMVPSRYQDYLRSGHGGLLIEVLAHNLQDVVSLALLLRVLAQEVVPAGRPGLSGTGRGPAPAVQPGDLGGLGRAYGRRRRHEEALACYDAALERLLHPGDLQRHESIAVERARTLTRLGRRDEAHGAWHAIALEGGRHAAAAWLHVAKHLEHDAREPEAALRAAERARRILERARLLGRRDRDLERDLARRTARLRRRLDGVGDRVLPTAVPVATWPSPPTPARPMR